MHKKRIVSVKTDEYRFSKVSIENCHFKTRNGEELITIKAKVISVDIQGYTLIPNEIYDDLIKNALPPVQE